MEGSDVSLPGLGTGITVEVHQLVGNVVELDTPYYRGTTKVLCMETPVQDIIIGNIPGARGTDVTFDTEHNHDLECVSDTLTNDIKITQEVISEQK